LRIGLALAALVLLVFGRSIYFDFVGFDDALHVSENPYFHPVSFANLLELWKQPYKSVYMPVTYSLLALLAKIGELPVADEQGVRFNPYLFHAADVLLHLINVMLVWRILRRLVANPWGAFFGAAIFAVHPLQVESVAWISSTKDLLSGTFVLATLLLCLRYATGGGVMNLALALPIFAAALLSKATAVVAPLLILILLLVLGIRSWKSLRWPSLLFLLVLPFLWLTRRFQEDASLLVWSPIWARPLEAIDAVSFYIWKLLWPTNLTIDYGRSPSWVVAHREIWAIWVLPVALLGLLGWKREKLPGGSAGALMFVAGLLPVLGLVPFEFQSFSTVADRYMYLPMVGIALIVAGVLGSARGNAKIIAICVLAILSIRSFGQVAVWRNSSTLFEHAITVKPDSGFGWYGIGAIREKEGDLPGAASAYRLAIAVRPDDLQALSSLAGVLIRTGPSREAALAYAAMTREAARRVLLKYPESALAHRKMGTAIGIEGHTEDAIAESEKAIHSAPSDAQAYVEYGDMLQASGLFSKAAEEYTRALRLQPGSPQIQRRLDATKKNAVLSTQPNSGQSK